MNILLIKDEARVADFIQRGLRGEGWPVSVAPDGESGLDLAERDRFDAILLDLMLPGISGQDVCRKLRAQGDLTPVLMLTALDKVDDRVSGLRLGADDYLAKPFDFDELVVRVEALTRRASHFGDGQSEDSHLLRIGVLTLNTHSLEVLLGSDRLELSTKERDILKLLMHSPERVHSRERILSAVWNASEDPMTNVVDVYISRLRRKLGVHGDAIETVRGAGYRLCTGRLDAS